MKHVFVSSAEIQKSLKDMNYPASRQDLMEHVKKGDHEKSGEIQEVLKKLPDIRYESPVDVSKAVSQVE